VQFPAKDIAIVSYLVDEELTADGEHQKLKCADTSTWIRQTDGQWKCVQHSEAPLRETIH
jgi:ketosteroid isomerase-like protein